jgi:hypothetical protein
MLAKVVRSARGEGSTTEAEKCTVNSIKEKYVVSAKETILT